MLFRSVASASLQLFGVGFEIDVYTSLIVIAIALSTGVITSLLLGKKAKA